MLSSDLDRFMDEQKGKFVQSTVNDSVIVEDHEIITLEKCIPLKFHIMEGFANHTFCNGTNGSTVKASAH